MENRMREKGFRYRHAELLLGILMLIIALGILFICRQDNMKFYVKKAPGTGFMPMLSAAVIALCGAGITVKGVLGRKKEDPEKSGPFVSDGEGRSFLTVIVLGALSIAAAKYVGLICAVTLMMILLIRFLGPESWKTSVLAGIGTGAAMYLIFVVFLKVHVPVGPLGF